MGYAPLENGDTVAAADVVSDFRRKTLVVHQQEVQLPDVADQELLEAAGEEVSGLANEKTVSEPLRNRLVETCLLVASVPNLNETYDD